MPRKLATPFNSKTARQAGLKSGAVRAAKAAIRRQVLQPDQNPDTLPVRLALERDGLLLLVKRERERPTPDPERISGFLTAIGKVMALERAASKTEKNGERAPRAARPMAEPIPTTPPLELPTGSVKSESPPEPEPSSEQSTGEREDGGALSDYPG